MFQLKKKQGTDISRSFDGLNDPRNLENSIKFAKEAGMISQAALSLTVSPVHTIEYYTDLANTLIQMGADEICVKDMAGVGRPVSIGKIIKNIKEQHPNIPITYHGHAGPGFQMASILEAANAGVDYIDVGMEPLSWGTGHADLLAVQSMLKDAGFKVADINMKAYMKVRSLTQKFMDDFLGYYISNKNRVMNSLLIGPGLPGGMMGSLMSDLEDNLKSLNKWKRKHDLPELTQDDLMMKLFDEVTYVWPKIGYPPLVTPFSQYVKNLALMNVIQIEKGKERWAMIADNIWDMILGKTGKLPGQLAPELVNMAEEQGREFYTGNPQDLYSDQLDEFRAEMKKNNWSTGKDDEELFELAMHPEQYRAYKSGDARKYFLADLEKKRAKSEDSEITDSEIPSIFSSGNIYQPKTLIVNVDNEEFVVNISYPQNGDASSAVSVAAPVVVPVTQNIAPKQSPVTSNSVSKVISSPLEGKFFLTKEASEKPLKVGDTVKINDTIGYIESMKTYNAIASEVEGVVAEICFANGSAVEEEDILVKVK
jgi:pyruvate carboxylase subunit B